MTSTTVKIGAAAAVVIVLAAGGFTAVKMHESAQSKTSKTQNLKLWVDTATKPTYVTAVKNFEKLNPKVNITIKYTNSTDALKNLQKDPSAAADVFMFPHD